MKILVIATNLTFFACTAGMQHEQAPQSKVDPSAANLQPESYCDAEKQGKQGVVGVEDAYYAFWRAIVENPRSRESLEGIAPGEEVSLGKRIQTATEYLEVNIRHLWSYSSSERITQNHRIERLDNDGNGGARYKLTSFLIRSQNQDLVTLSYQYSVSRGEFELLRDDTYLCEEQRELSDEQLEELYEDTPPPSSPRPIDPNPAGAGAATLSKL